MSKRSRKAPKLMFFDSPIHTQSPPGDAGEYFQQRDNEEDLLGSESDGPEYEELDTLCVTDFLNFDPKPTLVFDLLRHNVIDNNLEVIYTNKAFQSNLHLASAITPNSEPRPSTTHPGGPLHTTFRYLIKEFIHKHAGGSPGQPFSYDGFLWSGFTIRERWVLICGNKVDVVVGSELTFSNYPQTFSTTFSDMTVAALLKVSEETALAQSVPDFWKLALGALSENEYEFPFVLLYSVLGDVKKDATSSQDPMRSDGPTGTKSIILEGSLGFPEGHVSVQTKLDPQRHLGGYIPALREAMKAHQPTLLPLSENMLPAGLSQRYNWKGEYGEPCRDAVILPLKPTKGENTLGFVVIGVNPRRPYDAHYESFVKLLSKQLANSLASVTLFQNEIRRGTNAAAIAAAERLGLYEELARQKSRFQRIAEASPVGMFSVNNEGQLLEANDRFHEITNHPRDTSFKMSWLDTIAPSSLPTMIKGWEKLLVDNKPWSGELQILKPWRDPVTGDEFDNWILASYQQEFSSDGSINSIMGYCTDITLQKRFAREMENRAEFVPPFF